MDYLPAYEFRQCVERYSGNYKIKSFSCWDQFLSMAFAQLTYRESLRDIQACLRAAKQKTYHMGIRGKISRNTLAHANQTRDWRIYADFAQTLIKKARLLYANDSFGIELEQTIYALDATTIDLCLSLYNWIVSSSQRIESRLIRYGSYSDDVTGGTRETIDDERRDNEASANKVFLHCCINEN